MHAHDKIELRFEVSKVGTAVKYALEALARAEDPADAREAMEELAARAMSALATYETYACGDDRETRMKKLYDERLASGWYSTLSLASQKHVK